MILKTIRITIMFQKLAPLIVLAIFVTGMYFMLQGMDKAVNMTKTEKTKGTY